MPRMRWLAVLVTAMVLGGAGIGVADHEPLGSPTGPGDPPPVGGSWDPPPPPSLYSDVAPQYPHASTIYELAQRGWASGYPDGTFRPAESVQRGQMATFLSRALGLTADGSPSPFVDTSGSVHEQAIIAVWSAGVASGYPDGSFRPATSVTRGQMASFLVRAFGIAAAGQPSTFGDISGNTHEAAIEALAAAGITGGFPDGTFRPDTAVTRGQMATFLIRATYA
jgi:hypothetical protein